MRIRTLACLISALIPAAVYSQTFPRASLPEERLAEQRLRRSLLQQAPAVLAASRDATPALIVPLLPSPASQIEVPGLRLSYMEDGSVRVSGEIVASTGSDREILFLIDVSRHSYTATLVPQDPSAAPMYQRLGVSKIGRSTLSRESPVGGTEPMLLPEDPPEGCCDDMCTGQHYAYLETRDPINLVLTRTDQNSYWQVEEGYDMRCRWDSFGSSDCVTPPQGVSDWDMTGCRGYFPRGGYPSMNVFHETIGDYINWDFGSNNQSTTAHHDIYIYRSGRGGQTGFSFSFSHAGEYNDLLYVTVGDSGRNDC